MDSTALHAIGPVDGRYARHTAPLAGYFSESALIRYRVQVEVEYFIALCDAGLPQLSAIDPALYGELRNIYLRFGDADALAVKEIEKTTNHDVKAVEYFIKRRFDGLGIGAEQEFVHFGLTSQDVNNTAFPLMMRDATREVMLPMIDALIAQLEGLADAWSAIPLLARTHGQPASPTTLGKEMRVFTERLQEQRRHLISVPYSAKFGGATGNLNAHRVAYPDIDWPRFADRFVNTTLGLHRSRTTTQIEHYDNTAAWCDAWRRINVILIDLCRDVWMYVANDHFKQKIKEGEVGSSAMPHKVNPIDFENAEGNLGLANALLGHLAEKLPISRLQRDLTDSTVLRNIGLPLAYTTIALKSMHRGLDKLVVNEDSIVAELERNWVVVAEGIQTVLRREGFPKPYEALKAFTRTNARLDREAMLRFIDSLDVTDDLKQELRAITPFNYVGYA
jgi:adenylosuccinate lyase